MVSVQLSRRCPWRSWYLGGEVIPNADRTRPRTGRWSRTRGCATALRTLRDQATDGSYAVPSAGTGAISFRTPDIVDDAAICRRSAAVGEVDLPRLEEYVTRAGTAGRLAGTAVLAALLRSASRRVNAASASIGAGWSRPKYADAPRYDCACGDRSGTSRSRSSSRLRAGHTSTPRAVALNASCLGKTGLGGRSRPLQAATSMRDRDGPCSSRS